MFCKKCGAEMNDNASFCPKCGFERVNIQEQENKKIEDNQIKYKLNPQFKLGYQFITALGQAILYVFIFCFFFTNIYLFWFIYPITLLLTVLVIALYIVIKLVFINKQYEQLEYNFYNTKLEYIDGFLNKEEKELKYKHIREVTMRQNILERMFEIGTIRIHTNASSGTGYNKHSNQMRNGVFIHCIENVQEQYQKIKQIIDEGTEE